MCWLLMVGIGDRQMNGRSAEPSGDIIFGAAVRGLGENHVGAVAFHHLTKIEKRGAVGDARGLLHVVCYDDDGISRFQAVDQLLDPRRGDGIKCGTRLIHQDDLRIDRHRARDAKPLLLAAG